MIASKNIQYIIKRYNECDRVLNKVRSEIKKKLNTREERWIMKIVKDNPRITAPKLTAEVEKYLDKKVSNSTVRRIIRRNN